MMKFFVTLCFLCGALSYPPTNTTFRLYNNPGCVENGLLGLVGAFSYVPSGENSCCAAICTNCTCNPHTCIPEVRGFNLNDDGTFYISFGCGSGPPEGNFVQIELYQSDDCSDKYVTYWILRDLSARGEPQTYCFGSIPGRSNKPESVRAFGDKHKINVIFDNCSRDCSSPLNNSSCVFDLSSRPHECFNVTSDAFTGSARLSFYTAEHDESNLHVDCCPP